MKKFVNKIFAMILVLSVISCISGCGSSDSGSDYTIVSEIVLDDDGNDNNNNSVTDNNSTNNDSKDNAYSSKRNNSDSSINQSSSSNLNGTTVTFATFEDITSGSNKSKIISDFKKKTGIKVKIQKLDQDNYISKLSGYKAAGNSPDIIIDNQQFPRSLSLLQPLSNAGINANDSKFNQLVTNYGTVNGKQYLVGSAADGNYFLCFYNKNVFKQVGVPTPEELMSANNWNLDTFNSIAIKIHEYNSEWTGAALSPSGFQTTYGVGYIQYDQQSSTFINTTSSPEFSDIWRFVTTGVKAKYFYPRFNVDGVIKGTTGMTCVDTNGLMSDGYFSQMKSSEIGVTYLPKKNASDSEYPVGALIFGYGIADGAKNPKGAAAFLNYYLDPENISDANKFINKQAESIYKELLKKDIAVKNILSAKGPATITVGAVDAWDNEMIACDPAQVSVGIAKINSQINTAINKANEIIAQKK